MSLSVHDHGNCELCDQLEREVARLRKEITRYQDYIAWATEKNAGPLSIAWNHGWRCSEADIAEGKRRRDELAALAEP